MFVVWRQTFRGSVWTSNVETGPFNNNILIQTFTLQNVQASDLCPFTNKLLKLWAIVFLSQERPASAFLRMNRLNQLLYEQQLLSFYHVRRDRLESEIRRSPQDEPAFIAVS